MNVSDNHGNKKYKPGNSNADNHGHNKSKSGKRGHKKSNTGLSTDPYIIIVTGPTGSGKSTLPGIMRKYFKLADENTETILIDDMVENTEIYRNEIKTIVDANLDLLQKITNTNCNNPEYIAMYKQFTNAYYHARANGCVEYTRKTNGIITRDCNKALDQKLKQALRDGKNIVYEMTGKYYPSWICKFVRKFAGNAVNKYKIYLGYIRIDEDTVVRNNISRFQNALNAFINDRANKNPPRLPGLYTSKVAAPNYANSITESIAFADVVFKFLQQAKFCMYGAIHGMKAKHTQFCGNCGLAGMLVWDRSNDKSDLNVYTRAHHIKKNITYKHDENHRGTVIPA